MDEINDAHLRRPLSGAAPLGVQGYKAISKRPVRLFTIPAIETRDVALAGIACLSDLRLGHTGVHEVLNEGCPVHDAI